MKIRAAIYKIFPLLLCTSFFVYIITYLVTIGYRRECQNEIFYDNTSGNDLYPQNVNTFEKRLPNVIIIGEMKCGTTALSTFLSLHPDNVVASKEMNFFSFLFDNGFEWYREQMPPSRIDQLTIEKSVYFCSKFEPYSKIYKYNPKIKMILILRDPVQRTLSHFSMKKQNMEKYRNTTLKQNILDSGGNIIPDSNFIRRSLYFKCLLKWIKLFPLKQIQVIDGDQFIDNPLIEMKKIEYFLNIKSYYNSSILYYDERKKFYCYKNDGKDHCLPANKGRKHVEIPKQLKRKLEEFFKPWNLKLQEVLGKTFTWKSLV